MKISDAIILLNKHKKHASPEHGLQVAIVNLLRANNIFAIAIPNGGRRDAVTGAMLKKEGATAGAPDLVLILNDGETVWVELKTPKGRQSESQKAFQAKLQALRHNYLIWRSVNDCNAFVQGYRKMTGNLYRNISDPASFSEDTADCPLGLNPCRQQADGGGDENRVNTSAKIQPVGKIFKEDR